MLALPIKKKWFDMIKSGEKKEEYREIKPYWTSRFTHNLRKTVFNTYAGHVIFRNGYSKNSPRIKCCVEISKGTGNPEWGAEKRKRVLHIRDIGGVQMVSKEEMKEALRVGDDRTVIEYIEQLEKSDTSKEQSSINYYNEVKALKEDKQKLIDKLEKRRKQNNDRYGMAIDNDEFPEMYKYSGQVEEDEYILKIVKGESKNEKNANII